MNVMKFWDPKKKEVVLIKVSQSMAALRDRGVKTRAAALRLAKKFGFTRKP